MLQELKFQLSTAVLTILTVAAVVSAAINFQQQYRFRLPDDGVTWTERGGRVLAAHVEPNSPATRAGIHAGDALLRINGAPIRKSIDVTQILASVTAYMTANYYVEQKGVEVKKPVTLVAADLDRALLFQYAVAVAYLGIGLFVYFRRGSAHKARHFMILCLASFIFSAFHYTGKLNNFDKVIYWGNVAAGLFAPTIFLHFCLSFPEPRRWFRTRFRAIILYLPATLLLAAYVGAASGTLQVQMPLIELRWLLDRIWLPFLTVTYLAGAVVLTIEHRRSEDPIMRQQMKWLRNGTYFGILPFALVYVVPYMMGVVPNGYMKAAVLSLILIPLTLAWAVVRYRLMDVDIIFQRGYAYTLATLAVLAGFYGIVFAIGNLLHSSVKDLGSTGLISIMLLAAFLFQPIRNWFQDRLDKHFYRDRYDYRRTLIEFAREMSSETDLDRMLASMGERLMQTLNIRHLAFFMEDESGEYRLKLGMGLRDQQGRPLTPETPLDLSFLRLPSRKPYLFFDRTRYRFDAISRHRLDVVADSWTESLKSTIAHLDLNYYLPCTARGRTIAYLGVSRTEDGDYLSSEDVELLLTLSGYVGIAVENANLYRSLQRKVDEYERLKEFSENIVESINVGILAADLEDRVESWNSQMEQLTGIPRVRAVGRKLTEVFPPDLAEQLERVRGDIGIHHIYKHCLTPAEMPAHAVANGHGGRNPREATLNIAVAPLVSKDFAQIGRLVIFDDVTDRTELEQRLVQADKLSSIGLLAAGVAHEVNTPLAVISTYAQMLAKQVANDDQKSLILDKIAKQTFRASEIVNSLLNFSRTSTTAFGDVDVNRVVRETLSLLDHQLTKAGIHVKTELQADMGPIHGNPGKLQQVFLNLFLNARDAMDPDGTLEITSWSEDGGARLEISDTGHGISPEHIQRIYDPFFTTKAATRKGTGLGLSVTYGIIQEHGGSIEVSSRPGGGTRFHLELPWSKTAAPRKAVNV